MYAEKARATVAAVLIETKNKADIDVQRALTKAFPFHASNVVAWREYKKQIFLQSGRRM